VGHLNRQLNGSPSDLLISLLPSFIFTFYKILETTNKHTQKITKKPTKHGTYRQLSQLRAAFAK
jgi:hypothetical protein